MVRSASLLLALALLGAAVPADKPDADLGANAALKYWQAFSTLPKMEEKTPPADVASMPLDDKAKALAASANYSLEQMHYGAALPRCVWAASLDEDGIRTLLPHLPAARNLAALAVLRMRLRFADDKSAEALDDAVDALTLGRHASRDGTLIGLLVNIAIDQLVTDALAADLPKLDVAALKKLAARLDALPPAATVAECLRIGEERAGLDWFIRQVKEAKDKDHLLDLLKEVTGNGSRDEAKKFLDACGGDAEGVLKYAEQSRPLYQLAAEKMALTPDEFDKVWGPKELEVAKDNPVFKLLFPAVAHVRRAEARYQVRQALRKAALAILIDGPDAAKAQRDPCGDGPFEYVPFDGGFELRSKFKAQDKQVSLTVGRRKDK